MVSCDPQDIITQYTQIKARQMRRLIIEQTLFLFNIKFWSNGQIIKES